MKKWINMRLAAGCICFFAVLLSGCGLRVDPALKKEGEDPEEKLISVGFSQIGSESLWRTANTEDIQNTFTRENGYFLLFNNARQKQENQIKAIRSFISQRVDYILFSPVTEKGWETVLQEAKDAEIPVIMVDRTISVADESLYTAWIGTDFTAEGEKAGKWLEDYLQEHGREEEELNIVVLQGTTGSSAQTGRSEGFASVAEKHKNWHILAHKNGDFTSARGREVMREFLSMFSDIDVVISQNDDMTFGALEAMKEYDVPAGGSNGTIMISFDAAKQALQLVKEGIIDVDIECNPLQGAYIDAVIRTLEKGGSVDKINIVDEKVFTKENVDQYLQDRTY